MTGHHDQSMYQCKTCHETDSADAHMIICDQCRQWEHFRCAGISEASRSRPFICKQCGTGATGTQRVLRSKTKEIAIIFALGTLVGSGLANVCTDAGLTTTDGFLPHPTNCSMYISCYGGQPFEVSCPTGYNFNPTILKCDSKYVCVENTCPPTGIVIQPIEDSCTDYTLCIGGAAYPQQCETGLQFDPATLKCIPAEEAQCLENQCDPAIPPPQFFVNPFDCTTFFICDENFLPVEFQCANGTIFDETVNDCILGDTCPTDVATTTPAVDTTTTTTITTTTEETTITEETVAP